MNDKPAKKKTKRKVGRPKVEINWAQVEQMCWIQCTGEEIASIVGMSYDGLDNRIQNEFGMNFSEYFKKHSAHGKASLRRRQYKKAVEEGNPAMLIWLGKQWLGQSDHVEVETTNREGIKLAYDTKPQQLEAKQGDIIDVEPEREPEQDYRRTSKNEVGGPRPKRDDKAAN